MTAHKVFVSYTQKDRGWAQEFAKAMRNIGIDVWFDQFEIKAGQPLRDALEKGLRESGIVALLLNSENINSRYLFFELGAALGMNKTVVPVVPEDFNVHSLPLPLQQIRFLVRKSPEETAKELASSIESIHSEAA